MMAPKLMQFKGCADFGVKVYHGLDNFGNAPTFTNPIEKGEKCPVCGRTHRSEGETLPCYKRWLWRQLQENREYRHKVRDLWGEILVTALPSPCFGEILIAACTWLNVQTFRCHEKDCDFEMELEPHYDPTTSTGCCRCCGTKNWLITDREGNLI